MELLRGLAGGIVLILLFKVFLPVPPHPSIRTPEATLFHFLIELYCRARRMFDRAAERKGAAAYRAVTGSDRCTHCNGFLRCWRPVNHVGPHGTEFLCWQGRNYFPKPRCAARNLDSLGCVHVCEDIDGPHKHQDFRGMWPEV